MFTSLVENTISLFDIKTETSKVSYFQFKKTADIKIKEKNSEKLCFRRAFLANYKALMTLAFLLRVRQYAAFGLHPNIIQLLEKSGFFSFQICCLIIPGHMLINILVLIINFYMKIFNDRYRYYHLDSKNIGKIKFLKRTMKSYQKIQTS